MFIDGMSFNVRGTTFKNEDGIDIQSGIKEILKEYKEEGYIEKEELYGGYTNSEIKELELNVSEFEEINFGGAIVKSEYNGELCYKIYISKIYGIKAFEFLNKGCEIETDENYFHIGYVPKEEIEDLEKMLENENAKKYSIYIKIIGGKYKQSYCDDSYEEKIRTKTLTYGFEFNIFTDDGIKQEKTKIQKQEENTILKENNGNNTKAKNEEALSFAINVIGHIIIAIIALPFVWFFYTILSLFF